MKTFSLAFGAVLAVTGAMAADMPMKVPPRNAFQYRQEAAGTWNRN